MILWISRAYRENSLTRRLNRFLVDLQGGEGCLHYLASLRVAPRIWTRKARVVTCRFRGNFADERFCPLARTLARSLALSVRWPVSGCAPFRRQEMSRLQSFPRRGLRRPRRRPSSWRLARSSRSFIRHAPASQLLLLLIPHPRTPSSPAVPPHRSISLPFRPFLACSSFLLPWLRSNFVSPDIAELLVLSRRFHRNATARERRTRWRRIHTGYSRGRGRARRVRFPRARAREYDRARRRVRQRADCMCCSRTKFVLSAEKGECSRFKFYCADNTVTVMLVRL